MNEEMTDREFIDWLKSPERGAKPINKNELDRLLSISGTVQCNLLGAAMQVAGLRVELAECKSALARVKDAVANA